MHCKRVKICETRGVKISSNNTPATLKIGRVKFGSKTILCSARKITTSTQSLSPVQSSSLNNYYAANVSSATTQDCILGEFALRKWLTMHIPTNRKPKRKPVLLLPRIDNGIENGNFTCLSGFPEVGRADWMADPKSGTRLVFLSDSVVAIA